MSHYPTLSQSIIANYTMLDKYGKPLSNILGHFYFLFAFSLLYLGTLLRKQCYHSCLLEMRLLHPAWRYAPYWLSTISYPTCIHGISSSSNHLGEGSVEKRYFHDDWCSTNCFVSWSYYYKQLEKSRTFIFLPKAAASSVLTFFPSSDLTETSVKKWNGLKRKQSLLFQFVFAYKSSLL